MSYTYTALCMTELMNRSIVASIVAFTGNSEKSWIVTAALCVLLATYTLHTAVVAIMRPFNLDADSITSLEALLHTALSTFCALLAHVFFPNSVMLSWVWIVGSTLWGVLCAYSLVSGGAPIGTALHWENDHTHKGSSGSAGLATTMAMG